MLAVCCFVQIGSRSVVVQVVLSVSALLFTRREEKSNSEEQGASLRFDDREAEVIHAGCVWVASHHYFTTKSWTEPSCSDTCLCYVFRIFSGVFAHLVGPKPGTNAADSTFLELGLEIWCEFGRVSTVMKY